MITGKPGTGKTTLINDLLTNLDSEHLIVARMECIHMGREDLLRILAFSFNLDVHALDLTGILKNLKQFLIEQRKAGRKALLIVDEAQALSSAALEELRLLHNLHDEGRVLLQIYLIGQEQLADLINRPTMVQFRQRLLTAYHLEPLTVSQTEAYIKHRLRAVGWKGDPALHNEIFSLIHKFSHGIPRRINLVCNQLLTLGFENGQHELNTEDVRNTIDILRKERLLVPEPETESETAKSSTDIQQTESKSSLVKEPRAAILKQDDLYESEIVRMYSNSQEIPSGVSERKKQRKSRILWPVALFTLLLGGSLLGLVLALLLTVQKPLMNIFFLSEDEWENAQRVHLSTNGKFSLQNARSPFISQDGKQKPDSSNGADLMSMREKPEQLQSNSALVGLNQERLVENKPLKSERVPSGGLEQLRSVVPNGQTSVQIHVHKSDPGSVQPSKVLPQAPADIPGDLVGLQRQNLPQKSQANDDSRARVEEPTDITKETSGSTPKSKQNALKARERNQQFANLLETASQQRKEFKITLPAGDNAFETYKRVLELDPTNEQAKQGIVDLADYYRERAVFHKERGSLVLSLTFIHRGLKIMPQHPDLLVLGEQVERSLSKKVK